MPPSSESHSDIEAAVRRWNAIATASFPELKDSLDDARGELTRLLRAFEERRVLSAAVVLKHAPGAAKDALDELSHALAMYHVELRTLALQANRALKCGEEVSSFLAGLSGQSKGPAVLSVPLPPESAPGEDLIAALQSRLAELERENESLKGGSPSVESHIEPVAAPKTMQDELVRLRMEVEELREESLAQQADVDPPPEARIKDEAFDDSGKRRPMGLILLKAGLITTEQLEKALAHQRSAWNRHLGSILVELGFVEDEAVAKAIAAQTRTEFVRLTENVPQRDAVHLVSRKVADHHTVIPVRTYYNELQVAMANRLDLVALEDLKLASGRPIQPLVATATDIARSIQRHYSA